jgi:hypothetical protein
MSRELVAEGYRPSVVARVAKITRQAIYRRPKPRRSPQRRPPRDDVEQTIVAVAKDNPTDGYRMVWALARRRPALLAPLVGRAHTLKPTARVRVWSGVESSLPRCGAGSWL